MPIPLAPIAGIALRYGAVAVATYAVTKGIPQLRRDQRAEDALDDVDEGLALRRGTDQINAAGRFRRVVRLGTKGPGYEFDLTSLTRLKIRKIT